MERSFVLAERTKGGLEEQGNLFLAMPTLLLTLCVFSVILKIDKKLERK